MATAARSSLTVTGYGVGLSVERGALLIRDGLGTVRREQRLHRAERTTRRIIVDSATGSISLAALRWCADVGITLVVLDPVEHRILSINSPAVHDDARLRRAQATLIGTDAEIDTVRSLLDAKLAGQQDVLRRHFGTVGAIDYMTQYRHDLTTAESTRALLPIEANAALVYFREWTGTPIHFTERDSPRVPPSWTRYVQRTSPLHIGQGPRNGSDPINALLNYCYTLAHAEAVIACHRLGLDPGLGFLHRDTPGRESLAADLMEPARPAVDDYVLTLVYTTRFTRDDFVETRDGRCRLGTGIAETVAAAMPDFAAALAPHAENIGALVNRVASGKIRLRTPLTGNPRSATRQRKRLPAPPRLAPRCPRCGGDLGDSRRLMCPGCYAEERLTHARDSLATAERWLQELLAMPADQQGASELKAARTSVLRSTAHLWDVENPGVARDPASFRARILPGLQGLPVGVIAAAIAVTPDAALRIRVGTLVPHARHWRALENLAATSAPAELS